MTYCQMCQSPDCRRCRRDASGVRGADGPAARRRGRRGEREAPGNHTPPSRAARPGHHGAGGPVLARADEMTGDGHWRKLRSNP